MQCLLWNYRRDYRMLSDNDIQTFNRDCAIVLRTQLSSAWLQRIEEAIERDIAKPAPFFHGYVPTGGSGRFNVNLRIWETDPDFRAFCLHSNLPELAANILGCERINLLYDQLFVKEPSTPITTRWHNDQPNWPIRGRDVVSFWMAPDGVSKDSGSLEFISGSHKWGTMFQPERFGDTAAHGDYERNPDYVDMPDIDASRDDYDIISWDLNPGDNYVFHAMTVHSAGGNLRNDARRRGYAVRYVGDDIRYDARPGTNEHLRSIDYADGDVLTGPRFPQAWPR